MALLSSTLLRDNVFCIYTECFCFYLYIYEHLLEEDGKDKGFTRIQSTVY